MHQKDKSQNDSQINRLKGILFPKNKTKITTETQPSEISTPNANTKPINTFIKTEIQKLRGEISRIMVKGKENQSIQEQQTQRAYLDGINRMSKGLKDYTNQLGQVFDEFVEHLPTNLSIDRKNFTNHFFMSTLVQNVVWSNIENYFKRNVGSAFKAIQEQSISVKEQEEAELKIKNDRELRLKNRRSCQLNKFFNVWRYNNQCISLEMKNNAFLKENCIENDRKVVQNMRNLPLLVLMLEEICKDHCDHCQILIFEEKTNKFCKFIEEGYDCFNSSLQTVTQRSLLSGELTNKKFKRFEFESKPSLTSQCLNRRQVICAPNILKHPEYAEIDNNCITQMSQSHKQIGQNNGLIIYPLFDSKGELIGLLRQYFSQNGSKYVLQDKIEKISSLLEQGLILEKHSREILKQKDYVSNSYYLKMINLIKKLEENHPKTQNILKTLTEELNGLFKINRCSIYRMDKKQCSKRVVLHNIWGGQSQCQFVLSILDQMMKQGSNHLYLQKRLVIYSNLMVFDLQFEQKSVENMELGTQLLPVQLFTRVMAKIQVIVSQKQMEEIKVVELEEKVQQNDRKRQENMYRKELEKISVNFIADTELQVSSYHQIIKFVKKVQSIKTQILGGSNLKDNQPTLFIQIFEGKKQQKMYVLDQQWKEISKIPDQTLNISINGSFKLFVEYDWKQLIFVDDLTKTLETFYEYYVSANLTNKQKAIQNSISSKKSDYFVDVENIICQQAKQQWELSSIQKVFSLFELQVQRFSSDCLKVSESVQFCRDKPCQSNVEEWKNIMYQFALAEPSKIEISMSTLNQMVSFKEYQQNLSIFDGFKDQIEQKSWFTLSINKPPIKGRPLTHDYKSISIFIPAYCLLNELSQKSTLQIKVNETLKEIKSYWICLCDSFIKNINQINVNIRNHAIYKMTSTINSKRISLIRKMWEKMANFSMVRKHKTEKISKLVCIMDTFVLRKKLQNWEKLKMHQYNSAPFQVSKKSQKVLSSMIQHLTSYIFQEPFSKISLPFYQTKAIEQITKIANKAEVFNKSAKTQLCFDRLFYTSKQNRRNQCTIKSISYLLDKKMNDAFKAIKQGKFISNQKSEEGYENLFRNVKSMRQLENVILTVTPNFHLYLAIDSLTCYSIYSPVKSARIVRLEDVLNQPSSEGVYQIGSDSQLIWCYPINESQNSFTVKDILNNISKCVEETIKRCKEAAKNSLTNLFLFKNKWVNTLQSSYFKIWRNHSQNIGMLEKNRLNDYLYQISVESQTMKEKLKFQEKALKTNLTLFKELQRKKEEYQFIIKFNEQQVKKIQQSFSKLEQTRNVYSELHRRTVLKNTVLAWRNNSQWLKLTSISVKRTQNVTYLKKTALKSIFSVICPHISKNQRKALIIMSEFKQYHPRKVEISKIPVNFDENFDRLITFQSGIDEKQNSSRKSNQSESPDSKSLSKSLNKLKIGKMRMDSKLQDLSAEELNKYNNGMYKLNPKTLKFLKRMGKLEE